ncbi:MAG: glycerate kinase [Gammaproteobacteria bacterium]|nr:glycerate kinase [Gammaproteobacteria bacterium]
MKSNTSSFPLRQLAIDFFQTGITAANPYQAIKRYLSVINEHVTIKLDNSRVRTGAWQQIHLIAFGKAACPMIQAALDIIPAELIGRTIAVTNYENVRPISGINILGAAHPLPDEAGLEAATLCAEIAENAKNGELALVLISGGGSALIPYPAESITLQDKIDTTDLLLASGANINQINCVRKHLSQLKGGGLARLIAPADCHALILSDVIGDDISAIASGPTVPDDTTFTDAINILNTCGVWAKVPDSVRLYLEKGRQTLVGETPKSGDSVFQSCNHTLIGSNVMSINVIRQAATEQGFDAVVYNDKLCGETRVEAAKLAQFAKTQLNKANSRQPIAVLAGGETTVTINGPGRGGRNQEMALSFTLAAEQLGLPANWVFLSGGTDGRDGPTDVAGGIVDSGTLQRIINAGVNPINLLDNNDSYTALKLSDDLLITGATGTNVADLQVLLIQPQDR